MTVGNWNTVTNITWLELLWLHKLYFYSCVMHAHTLFVENYSFKEFVVNTRALNCLTKSIQNHQKEISKNQFYYLGNTFLKFGETKSKIKK